MPINEKAPRPQEFAAVDLGSNSFHMVIARVVDGAMQIIGRLKQRVHLADGLDENSVLSEEAIARGLSCLSLFAERLQGFAPSSVCIVGTHTLRQAANAAEFLKRAEQVIPYPIEIISGNEEARLIFMGVEHTQPERGRKLVIDIGGGSTELVIGEDFEPRLVESRRMGCVSFSQIYFAGGIINKENFQRARLSAVQKLETLAWQFRIPGLDRGARRLRDH
ncbi:Exopolyphosphatase [Raoultella terrigena]|uniref:Exopolyphosphatase n=1 Tax=Raoultella terrigena TaxID=577 RepID=A0A4U9D4V9_RAOTE|nr:Exopolyphosphatase [Raoultella terrigena]